MITQELVTYIRGELAKGTPIETIQANLKSQGWTDQDISEANRIVGPQQPIAAKPAASAPVVQTSSIIMPGEPVATAPSTLPAFTKMPSMPTTNYVSGDVRPKKHHKKGLLITLAVLIILLAGASYVYAFGYLASVPFFSKQVLSATQKSTSVSYDASVGVDISKLFDSADSETIFPGVDLKHITLLMKGSSDTTTVDSPKSETTVSLNAGTTGASVEMRFLNKTLYGQITKAPDLGFFSINEYLNKWYSFAYDPANPSKSFDMLAPVIPVDTAGVSAFTEEQKAHLVMLAQSAHFINITNHYAPEKVNGVLSQHLGFDLDKAGIATYMTDVVTYLQSQYKDNPEITSLDTKDITKAMDNINHFKGDVWVGMLSHLPTKVTTNFGVSEVPGDAKEAVVTMTINLTDWNTPKNIVAPATSTSLTDLINSARASAKVDADQSRVQGTLSSMRASAEILYSEKNSYAGFCTSTYYTDLAGPLKTELPGVNPLCRAIKTAWVAYAQVPGSSTDYFCVDGTGQSITTTKTPTGFACIASQ